MIQGVAEIRQAYRDETVAQDYVAQRFVEPLGALLHDRQVAALKQVIAAYTPRHVLEIAPGPARLTVEVAPLLQRPPVVIDASAQMLTEARGRLQSVGQRASMIEGDAFQLPFAATFDLAYSFRLIRHFEPAERAKLYRQIGRVLRPGGLLVFDAVNARVSKALRAAARDGEYLHYDALLDADEVTREVRAEGFSVVSLIGVQHRMAWLQRVQVLVSPRSRPLARLAMELLDRSGGEPLEWVVVCRRG